MSSKGMSLKMGEVVILSLDGTLVYIEQVAPTFVGVVALPEQDDARSDERVFVAGRVGMKKISPYAKADIVVDVNDLSERNRAFLAGFEKLRAEHGPNYIDMTEAERAAKVVTKVTKAKPAVVEGQSREDRKAARRAEREAVRTARRDAKAAAKAAAASPPTCAFCDAGNFRNAAGVHFDGTDESGKLLGICAILLHGVGAKTPKSSTPRTPREIKAPSGEPGKRYHVLTTDLTTAIALNPKFTEKNRGGRVFAALCAMPDQTGNVAEVMTKTAELFGDDWCRDPEKITTKALKELTRTEFGACLEVVV